MPIRNAPRWMIASVASLTTLSLLSCSAGSGDPVCAGFHPIYPSRDDVMTPQTQRQILTHDQYGAARCGWKP